MNTKLDVQVFTFSVGPNQIEYLRALRSRYRTDYKRGDKASVPCVDLNLTPDQVVENVQYVHDLRYEPDDVAEDHYHVTVALAIKVYLPAEDYSEGHKVQGHYGGTKFGTR